MPISKQRLTERGFNQSLLLANLVSKQLKIPVWQPVQRLNEHSQKDYLDSKDLKILNSNLLRSLRKTALSSCTDY